MQTNVSRPRQHPFPLIRGGGLFLILIGLTIVIATLLGGNEAANLPVFYIGTGLGLTALFVLAKPLSYGPPTRIQVFALIGAILLEVLLFILSGLLLNGSTARTFWLAALFIVGLHFLPMSLTFGRWMLPLGLLCLANAGLGLWWVNVPFWPFGLIDGLLKIAFGAAMLLARPVEQPSERIASRAPGSRQL
jgi:hypothetical protein